MEHGQRSGCNATADATQPIRPQAGLPTGPARYHAFDSGRLCGGRSRDAETRDSQGRYWGDAAVGSPVIGAGRDRQPRRKVVADLRWKPGREPYRLPAPPELRGSAAFALTGDISPWRGSTEVPPLFFCRPERCLCPITVTRAERGGAISPTVACSPPAGETLDTIWETDHRRQGRPHFKGIATRFMPLAFSPDGTSRASSGRDHTVLALARRQPRQPLLALRDHLASRPLAFSATPLTLYCHGGFRPDGVGLRGTSGTLLRCQAARSGRIDVRRESGVKPPGGP